MLNQLTIIAAKYLIVAPLLLVLWEFWRANGPTRRVLLKRGLLAGVIAIALAKIGGALYYEPRPFMAHHFTPLIPHEPDNGFPSDHTLLAFTCVFLLLAQRAAPIAILAGACAVAVASARIASGLHSPLDIAASILFAALGVGVSVLTFRTHQGRRRKEETFVSA